MNPIIEIQHISKKYSIGANKGYLTLRENLSRKFRSLASFGDRRSSASAQTDFWALKDVSFSVQEGEVVGIIGRNGAGKSTLLKILSKITPPTEGQITMRGRVASLLEVGTGFHPELTGRENIYLNGAILGMTRSEIRKKFDEIVAFAEVDKFLDTPVKRYSSGMYVRLAFAVAAHLEPEILVVDEVLAVGDAEFQKKCLGKMGEMSVGGRTVVFVTHNMDLVSSLCSKGVLLQEGKTVGNGAIDQIVKQYEELTVSALTQTGLPYGVLYADDTSVGGDKPIITKIFMCTKKDGRYASAKSFEDLTLGIEIYAPENRFNTSVDLYIQTLSGITILRIASNPDCGCRMDFLKGKNTCYCEIKKLPLPGGDYVLTAGLAIPMREWLMPKKDLCIMNVESKDLYGSGFHLNSNLCLAMADVKWVF